MENTSESTAAIQEFQIIFDKINEAKVNHPELIASVDEISLNESIKEIRQIVESLSTPTPTAFFTKS